MFHVKHFLFLQEFVLFHVKQCIKLLKTESIRVSIKERADFMKPMQMLKKMLFFQKPVEGDLFTLEEQQNDIKYDVRTQETIDVSQVKVDPNLETNFNYLKSRFSYPKNNDFVMRRIAMRGARKCFLIFYDGMVSTDAMNLAIINTLQELPLFTDEELHNDPEAIIEQFVSHSQAMATDMMEDIIEEVNFGSCGLFVDGMDKGFILDVRSWGHRSIDKPENEQSIYGPQEAFAEMLRNNSALVRKILKTEKLICEGIKIGKISKTRGVLMYISDLANESLVNEVRRKIDGITMDYVIAIEEVAMMLEENTFLITNQLLATERPDRVARALSEGRVALLLNGSPRALIFPTNAFELTHSASDAYLRVPFANMSRIVRLVAMLSSILLPALYIAITLFHQELVPTYLLFAISASRENVPFSTFMEFLLMDFSFEMIREAGIRMPGPIGSTLGIVGGLILGQAAVSAKIVSPLMIIVIAITGIGSFATSDYSLGWSYRILKWAFVLLATISGFYGVAIGIFMYALYIGAQKSFGIPFLSLITKGESSNIGNSVFVGPLWKKEKRPDFLSPKDKIQEPKISRKWKIGRKDQ